MSPPTREESPQPRNQNSDSDRPLRRWRILAAVAGAIIVLSLPAYLAKKRWWGLDAPTTAQNQASFVGAARCAPCHESAYQSWQGSDHDLAMAVADETSVLGDFDDAVFEHEGITSRFYRRGRGYFVYTEGPEGVMQEFEIAYTFGYDPLQQYLVPFPGGRLQCLTIAWDTEQKRWFHLYPGGPIPPDDWLHWTRGAQNWNGMCAECHSTDLEKRYDPQTQTFDTTWAEIDVSCEACHGPGSAHVAWAEVSPMGRRPVDNFGLLVRTSDVDANAQVELCAPCHSRRTEMGDYEHTGSALMDRLVPSLLEEGLYHPDGQILDEVYVYGSFVQSKMYRNGIRCSDCHDVHSLTLRAEGNDLCTRCHQADAYDSYDHHFHQKVHEGKPSEGALCVKCHMPERTYMVVDERADHSLRVPRPDLTAEIGTPNACTQAGCHDDRPLQWSIDAFTTWYGKARRPHYGTALAAGRRGDPGAQAELARIASDALYPSIVRATALSLVADPSGRAYDAVFQLALEDEDPLLRYTAVQSLQGAAPPNFVERIAPLLFDPVQTVRAAAAARLAPVSKQLTKDYQRVAFEAARAEFESAMRHGLDFPHGGYNLGNLHAALGNPGRAEAYYRLALGIDELFHPAKVNLAMLLNRNGRNQEAETLLRQVLEDEPDLHEVAYSLGLLLAEEERYEDAAAMLGRAAEGLPERPRIQYNLGLALQHLGRPDRAEAALERAVALDPENLDFLYGLAVHYVQAGRPREALAVADRMIAAHPEAAVGRELKGVIQRDLRR